MRASNITGPNLSVTSHPLAVFVSFGVSPRRHSSLIRIGPDVGALFADGHLLNGILFGALGIARCGIRGALKAPITSARASSGASFIKGLGRAARAFPQESETALLPAPFWCTDAWNRPTSTGAGGSDPLWLCWRGKPCSRSAGEATPHPSAVNRNDN
jgi:hypothetical protein